MPEDNIVRLCLESAVETQQIGGLLGEHFLHPMVTSRKIQNNQPVVAFYGATSSGKTTFIAGICKAFPHMGQYVRRPLVHKYDNIVVRVPSNLGKPNRHRIWDFGWVNGGLREESMLELGDMPLRATRASWIFTKPGFDCLKHPPIPYLKRAHLVVLMREPGVPDCTRRYFEHKIQYIPADLPASAAIVGEMQWLMKLDETPQPRRGHHASILLITENPVMQAAFDNFRKNVPQKFTPG